MLEIYCNCGVIYSYCEGLVVVFSLCYSESVCFFKKKYNYMG